MNSRFKDAVVSPNFPEEEVKIMEYWDQINAFQEQLNLTKD